MPTETSPPGHRSALRCPRPEPVHEVDRGLPDRTLEGPNAHCPALTCVERHDQQSGGATRTDVQRLPLTHTRDGRRRGALDPSAPCTPLGRVPTAGTPSGVPLSRAVLRMAPAARAVLWHPSAATYPSGPRPDLAPRRHLQRLRRHNPPRRDRSRTPNPHQHHCP